MAILLQNTDADSQVHLRRETHSMKALHLKLGIVVAGLLLTAGPVLAQRPDTGGGAGAGADRGGSTTSAGGGTSSNAGGGGGNIAASGGGGGSSSSTSSGGGGFSSPSASAISSPSISMSDRAMRTSAPEHRVSYSEGNGQRARTNSDGQRTPPRSASGSSTPAASPAPAGDRAVSRGVAASNGGGTRRANESTAANNASGASEVPSWSRPRGDRPATDTAVPRVGPRPDRNPDHGRGGDGYYYDPYYYGGFGYGLGLGFYDSGYYGYPFYSPFGFGYGIPSGYFDPYASDPYAYGGGYGAYSSHVYGGHDQGNLKLKVKPRTAKVYVDGYYVGLVDEFDGAFQKLTLNGGRHKVELRADGYETTEFDVLITPEQTITFAGDMKKVQ